MNDKSILFIDSGIGGISTLYECKKLLKNESFIYYADSVNAPFGALDTDFITNRIEEIITSHIGKIKAVVLACNTATSASIKSIRESFKILSFGIEPAIKPAIENLTSGKILLLATPVTASRLFVFRQENLKYKEKIVCLADVNLSVNIEKNIFNKNKLKKITYKILEPFNNEEIESVVLGCTHYIFIKHFVEKFFKNKLKVYDGNGGLARRIKQILEKENLLSNRNSGKIIFENSLKCQKLNRKMKKVLKKCNKF